MIDQASEHDRVNIKDLIDFTRVKHVELRFDPERDITPELWETELWELENSWTAVSGRGHAEKAANMLILFPDRREQLPLATFEGLISTNQRTSPSDIKIIYPKRKNEELEKKLKISFDQLKASVTREKTRTAYWINVGAVDIWDSFILFPERFDELKNISELPDTLLLAANEAKYIEWNRFAEFNVAHKLLGQNSAITSDEWDSMTKYVKRHSENQHSLPLSLLAKMKMLTAKEIKMTPEGLKLIMPDDVIGINDIKQSVPVGRKF